MKFSSNELSVQFVNPLVPNLYSAPPPAVDHTFDDEDFQNSSVLENDSADPIVVNESRTMIVQPFSREEQTNENVKLKSKCENFFFLINSNVFKDIFYYYHRHSFSLLLLKMKKICFKNYDFVIIEMMMKILLKIEKSSFFLFCLCFILYKIYIFFSIH